MRNWKIFSLLLLGLLAFSQISFAGASNVPEAGPGFQLLPHQPETFISFNAVKPDDQTGKANQLFTSNQTTERDSWFQKNITKYKKKYKRLYSSSTRLKQPVKDIDIVPVNIFTKDLYSKPHFLSLLHHFLFRLTPF